MRTRHRSAMESGEKARRAGGLSTRCQSTFRWWNLCHADPSPGLGPMPHRLAARTAPSETPRSKENESWTGSAHPSRGLSGTEDLGKSSLASGDRKRLGLAARGALWVLWFASVVQTFQTAWKPAGPAGGAAACRGEAGVRQRRPCGSVLLFLIPARPRSLSRAFQDLHFVPYLRLSSV